MDNNVISFPATKLGRNESCPCGSGKKYKKCCLEKVSNQKKQDDSSSRQVDATSVLRDVERTMAQLKAFAENGEHSIEELRAKMIGKTFEEFEEEFGGSQKRSSRSLAQELVYDAWEEESASERIRLAKDAIELWPDCADAFSILADDAAQTERQALQWTELAVAASERALCKDFLKENKGHFWGMLETRPYMRARLALAQRLWLLEKKDEAIEHAWELLKLNPNDNQGARFILLNWLLAQGDTASAAKLFKKYKSDFTADWVFSKVLYTLQVEGPGTKAEMLLKKAVKVNAHVLKYLKKPKFIPRELPCSYALGSEDEAAVYVVQALEAWSATAGALHWIKNVVVKV